MATVPSPMSPNKVDSTYLEKPGGQLQLISTTMDGLISGCRMTRCRTGSIGIEEMGRLKRSGLQQTLHTVLVESRAQEWGSIPLTTMTTAGWTFLWQTSTRKSFLSITTFATRALKTTPSIAV